MGKNPEKNEVFGDYAAFLHALLPKAQAFLFHDRHGRLFWHDNAPDTSQLSEKYHDALKHILEHGDLPGDQGRIELRDSTAYIIRLHSDKGKVLGVLTALVAPEMGGMPWKFCSDMLQPALRSLTRELSLRVHLLDVNQKLGKQDNEYDFLKVLGDKARESNSCGDALRATLELCAEQLRLDGAVFYAPDLKLSVSVGSDPVRFEEVKSIYTSMKIIADSAGKDVSAALAKIPEPDPRERARSWPILEGGKRMQGVLVLSRPVDSGKLSSHAMSLASFVVSTIEYVLERGFDSLTGLINWPGFETSLEQARQEGAIDTTLMYLDLDQLNIVNDTFGRETGDELLRSFSAILRHRLDGFVVTRVSSDAFVALLTETSIEKAEKIAEEICVEFKSLDFSVGEKTYHPSVSIGISPLLNERKDTRSLLVPAQVACQAAKERGRGRVEIYKTTDDSIVRRVDEIGLIASIRNAIDAGELVLYSQPIFRLSDNDLGNYYELLVRMLDADGNAIEPSEFMGAAERFQLIQEIDRWVVAKAIETLAESGSTHDGRPLRFAVNLSGQSLGNDQFLDFVRSELARRAVSPDRLCFEITETVAVTNQQKAQHFIQELKALGCQFSLDDFGTGLSSFGYLKLFAVDKLKIDGSFVHDLCQNEVSRSMVTAIVEIARVMKIQTVAEYVQDEETIEALREIGVDWAQGYHVGAPSRLSELFDINTEDSLYVKADTSAFLEPETEEVTS